MRIHETRQFPNPRRVRMFLAEKGIDDMTFIEVDVPGGEARLAPFARLNPLGQVPVLELDDGSTITESTAISLFFEALRPEPPLFGRGARERARVAMWQQRVEARLFGGVDGYFHHATPGLGALETYRNANWGAESGRRAHRMMEMLDAELATRPFVAGESFSIADITAFCAVDFADLVGLGMPGELPCLAEWRQRIAHRHSAAA
jgi:glutathione S-transferase